MKLAILGAAAIVAGLVAGIDGLVYVGGAWFVGGAILRLVVGSPDDLEPIDGASATWSTAYGGKRGFAVVLSIVLGVATVAIGLVPIGFESDEPWRWVVVALGGLMAGVQLLALLMFSAGSGLQAVTGHVGDPDHPATITLDAVSETGVYINERPRLELSLTVEPDGAEPYPITIKQVVGHAELGSLRPGERYRGLVDLERPDAVRIDWHEIVSEPVSDDVERDPAARLARIDRLRDDGVITAAEHADARQNIIDSL